MTGATPADPASPDPGAGQGKGSSLDLHASAEILARLLDAVPHPVFVKDRAHRWVLMNEAACALIGRPRDALLGRTDHDVFPKPQADCYWAGDDAVFASGEALEVEEDFTSALGRWHVIRTHKRLVRLPGGGEPVLIASVTDVTESRRAEQALRESEENYRYTIELSPQVAWTADPEGRILEVGPHWSRLTGMAREETLGTGWARAVDPDDREGTLLAWSRALRTGESLDVEWRLRLAAGGHRWVRVRAAARRDGGGRILRWYGTLEDVTDRRQAEEALREGEARFRALADDSPVMIWMTDADGANVFANRLWSETTGMGAEETRGFGWMRGIHPEDQEATHRTYLAAVARQERFRLEYRLRRAGGGWAHVIGDGRPRHAADGRFLGYVGSVTDITERKEAEERLRESERLFALGRLTGGIAHDFNNMLTVIAGNLEFLEGGFEPEAEAREAVRAALRAADSAAGLTEQLLAFAQQRPLRPAAVDVNAVLLDVQLLARRLLGGRVSVEASLGRDLPPVVLDRVRLENALLNLALNARDAMPDGGTLRVGSAVRSAGPGAGREREAGLAPVDQVEISVADTGCGIPPEHLPRVFEPFFTTKAPGQGTGLGLAVVYGFVRQSGGEIAIESIPGEGTTVRLRFPAVSGKGAAC